MKILKYTLFVLGGIMALNVIGGLFMVRAIPLLWVIMIAFFIGGALIKNKFNKVAFNTSPFKSTY